MKQKPAPLIKTHRRTASGNMRTVTATGNPHGYVYPQIISNYVGFSFKGFFSRYALQGNPFDDVDVEDEGEDVLAQNGVCTKVTNFQQIIASLMRIIIGIEVNSFH